MKIVSFEIKNYRSIVKSETINLAQMTVLIGPNNEGKSNILSALVSALRLIERHAENQIERRGNLTQEPAYVWRRDYPVSLQSKPRHLTRPTVFRITFELDEGERSLFKKEINSRLSGILTIEVSILRGEPEFRVVMRGPGQTTLERKSQKIASFLGKRIAINYIPAIRIEQHSTDVIGQMISQALRNLERKEDYIEAIKTIDEIQRPILEELSSSVATTMRGFLPQVKDVRITISAAARFRALRASQIVIDDGTPTPIERKGDGVKSLAAISLMQELHDESGISSILAIEEPEAHLHPAAIHRLKAAIEKISSTKQVILTTHCPVLAIRDNISANVIVKDNAAKSARSITEIRECLGVQVADNLFSASFVLVVKGPDDKITLGSILPHYGPAIREALRRGTLAIDYVGGAGNLSYKCSMLKSTFYQIHALVDNDTSGKTSVQASLSDGTLVDAEYTLTNCIGMPESELEDCLKPEVYREAIFAQYGVEVNSAHFRGNQKWSDRIKRCFEAQGKIWNERTKQQVKLTVANAAAANPDDALHEVKGDVIRTLIQIIETKIHKNVLTNS
jgi:putative ATP-dependent endonuclease of OLD family